MGQTTADGRFTLLPIVCLGACDRGPAMMVDDELHGPVAPDQVAGILGGLRMTSRPGLPGYSAEDRPFTRAMRADGRPATLDDYVAAGGYEGAQRERSRDLEPPEVTTLVTESGPARPRRRRLLHRAASGAPCRSARTRRAPSTSSATPTRWSPAASRTASSWSGTRTCCSRACCSPASPPRRTTGYIFLRQQYDGSVAALEQAHRRSPRARLPRQGHARLRASASTSTCT